MIDKQFQSAVLRHKLTVTQMLAGHEGELLRKISVNKQAHMGQAGPFTIPVPSHLNVMTINLN